ncbi:hypothetical protein LHK_01664 [Laribacter hongkongensis HLHK9]|uniref:Phage protein n=1 Tax=Laribacter hongkongensis (strain HLHK9) TaxID=557598 RepID=C1D859_LARHH|nr:hypothetical protein [Laribacter hongkongensis]ACO74649.1 hypothetical protein LHK_01664 [Laribacter hongkongensis HLHK9]
MRLELSGEDRVRQQLLDLASQTPKQANYATAVALTRTAQLIRTGARQVMQGRFDRPTPYTLNSIYVRGATRSNLTALVNIKDESYKSAPASRWLRAEIDGGERHQKRSEKLISRLGLGNFMTPADAPKDGFGNVNRGFIVKMLSGMKAMGEQGYMANRTKGKRSQRKARNFDIFAGNPDGMGPGIWQRVALGHGTGLKPLMWLHDSAPQYRAVFPFEKIAENIYRARFSTQLERAIAKALATAR